MTDYEFSTDDTICAISTAPGTGGIAVIRVSGPNAFTIVERIWRGRRLSDMESHTCAVGTVVDADNNVIDRPVATVFRGPKSFTGQDTVELSVHGSVWIQRQLIEVLTQAGARLAGRGEFTRRAYSSGKLDLAEAEAVADLINASSKAAHRMAISQMRGHLSQALGNIRGQLIDLASLLELELDFSEEDLEFASRIHLRELSVSLHETVSSLAESFATGNALKNGIPVALAGLTNVGKSTILNLLLNEEKAIISDIHGTTRDTIEDTLTINGTLFRIIDTAGLRETADTVERIGIARAKDKISKAAIVIWITDATSGRESIIESWETLLPHLTADTPVIAVINKIDLKEPDEDSIDLIRELCPHSAIIQHTSQNPATLAALREAIMEAADMPEISESDIIVTNHRHYQALRQADENILRVIDGLDNTLPPDLIAQDLRQAIHHLGEITGEITPSDILTTIFSRFCIGK